MRTGEASPVEISKIYSGSRTISGDFKASSYQSTNSSAHVYEYNGACCLKIYNSGGYNFSVISTNSITGSYYAMESAVESAFNSIEYFTLADCISVFPVHVSGVIDCNTGYGGNLPVGEFEGDIYGNILKVTKHTWYLYNNQAVLVNYSSSASGNPTLRFTLTFGDITVI